MPLRAPQHACTQDGGVCSITGHAGHGEGVHTHIDAHSGYQTENTPEYTQLYMGNPRNTSEQDCPGWEQRREEGLEAETPPWHLAWVRLAQQLL